MPQPATQGTTSALEECAWSVCLGFVGTGAVPDVGEHPRLPGSVGHEAAANLTATTPLIETS